MADVREGEGMIIERELVPEMTIEDFADSHGLVMQVMERESADIAMAHIGPNGRFYAHFKGAEIKGNRVLISTFGDGATEANAIANYAKEISEKILVFNAYDKAARLELKCPRFVEAKP